MSTSTFDPRRHPRAAAGSASGGAFVVRPRTEPDVLLTAAPERGQRTAQEGAFSDLLDRHAHGLVDAREAWTQAKGLALEEMGPAISAARDAAVAQAIAASRDVAGSLAVVSKIDHLVALCGWRHPADTTVAGSSRLLGSALEEAGFPYPDRGGGLGPTQRWGEDDVDTVVGIMLGAGFVKRRAA